MVDYKYTLNLPSTKLPMKANLVRIEPLILKNWYDDNLYELIRYIKKGKKIFFLHDGPPYVNGNIHIGHAVNKILKDIIVKFKGLMGYDAPYIPGWDCHGLPIELKVEQLIGTAGKKVNFSKFRTVCRDYAITQVIKQKEDFIRLGILGDWSNPYLTMDYVIEANVIRSLGKIIANGYVYRGIKPVHWCIDCCSVLAEAEVEHYDCVSPSIYVNFSAVDSHEILFKYGLPYSDIPVSLVVWTTTPWSLPDNRALAVHPNFDYQLVEIKNKRFIFASFSVEKIMKSSGILDWKILGSIKGSQLEWTIFSHPFMNFNVPVILGKHVVLHAGTGIIHTAPAHGFDDYIIGQQYQLEIVDSISSDGVFVKNTFSELDGLQCFKANKVIIHLLEKLGNLFYAENIHHSYPHCWRHKSPIIFRATPQWFISLDKHHLREQILEEIDKVDWIPKKEKSRMRLMIVNRPDWCISRQRYWGVPIPVFIHKYNYSLHPCTVDFIEHIAKLIEKKGIQAWWDLDPIDLIGSDAAFYHKLTDTLDVWFDSGSTSFSVVSLYSQFLDGVSDLYLEGSDQYRGWFMSSLIISVAIKKQAPYRQVLSHGFVVDSVGHKMSKSSGNVVTPQEIVEKLGADILRLWVASTNYCGDMTISDEILQRSIDIYRRIRNTVRFLLANLSDFNPSIHIVKPENMIAFDLWVIGQAYSVQKDIIMSYNEYNFHNVIKLIMNFCSMELGSCYLDITKDRQYTTKADSIARRSCQTALYHIIEAMVRWISPIISFTASEIWNCLPGKRSNYVFTEEWYDSLFYIDYDCLMNNDYWNTLFQVRNEVNKAINKARTEGIIKSSLEASIILYAEPSLAEKLRVVGSELYFLFLTSTVMIVNHINHFESTLLHEGFEGLKIFLKKAEGKKCHRCWHYEIGVGSNNDYPDLCKRCILNIFGPGEDRRFI
ncbi:isoleucine--tRNA ligase [Blochmannia endosymbiont of Colobopsis nipponica]|uniref:isoleucine--tRNA ligase n=1 Tax=Blochmannia endosymbiont of Colobopsis nipponica TaxID=2681987 RepID=UPI0017852D98|nr:isoleucine--tRNA ligase [Blochmannia endosymbiont of Colobopsis nipponica]QOI11288.1 isoleucine--tRNA ligase [Blochmannia endosymbiont of Colobopsis nipponica]